MKKFLQKKLKNEKGMTLIELLAVIVIIAIIAAIAIPAIGNIIENSRVGAMKSDYLNAIAAAELYVIDNPNDTSVSLANLRGTPDAAGGSTEVYLDDAGSLTDFDYVPATDTFDGNATTGTGGIVIAAAAGTTKANINDLANSSANGTYSTNITVSGR